MASPSNPEPIHIGLFSNVPNRHAEFSTVFGQGGKDGTFVLTPITGSIDPILRYQHLQCLILDLKGVADALNLIRDIHCSIPSLRLLIIDSNCSGETAVDAVLAGARGCIDPNCDSITAHQAVKDVLEGLFWLSPQVMSIVIDRLLGIRRSED